MGWWQTAGVLILAALKTLDWIALGVCLLFAVRGAMKGFAWTAVRSAGVIVAVWAAFRFQIPVATWIGERVQFVPEPARPIVASLAILIGILVVATWLAWLVRGLVKEIRLGDLDRLLGFGLGAIMGLLVLTFGFFVWGQIWPNNETVANAVEGSYAGQAMAWVTEQIRPLLSEEVIEKWDGVMKYVEKARPVIPGN